MNLNADKSGAKTQSVYIGAQTAPTLSQLQTVS